jgi:hypothetical protein
MIYHRGVYFNATKSYFIKKVIDGKLEDINVNGEISVAVWILFSAVPSSMFHEHSIIDIAD